MNNIMKTRISKLVFAVVLFALISVSANAKQPKYVFYFIGDGMGINHVYATQIYNREMGLGPQTINFNQFPVKTIVTTHSSESLVTDSAAAGTALATGVKTYNHAIGVGPDKNPVSSVAEWAKAAGYGVGIATSVGVNHATPAAFYAHSAERSNYEEIGMQLATVNVDFVAGAGFLNEVKKTGHDSKYLEDYAAAAGVTILRGEALEDIASYKGRVICLSADPQETELKYAIDRDEDDTKLGDFVQAGIDYLYSKYASKGFFFMVEGGKIDYGAHNNDGAATFQEVNDFASSIDLALAFYNRHPEETIIVVTADHETGGLMLGTGGYVLDPRPIFSQRYSEVVLNAKFREFVSGEDGVPTWARTRGWFMKNLGLWETVPVPSKDERKLWESYEASFGAEGARVVSLYSVSTKVISEALDYVNRRAGFSWAHGSHTGSPVGLYVMGSAANIKSFAECRDNTDIPAAIAKVAGYKR